MPIFAKLQGFVLPQCKATILYSRKLADSKRKVDRRFDYSHFPAAPVDLHRAKCRQVVVCRFVVPAYMCTGSVQARTQRGSGATDWWHRRLGATYCVLVAPRTQLKPQPTVKGLHKARSATL